MPQLELVPLEEPQALHEDLVLSRYAPRELCLLADGVVEGRQAWRRAPTSRVREVVDQTLGRS